MKLQTDSEAIIYIGQGWKQFFSEFVSYYIPGIPRNLQRTKQMLKKTKQRTNAMNWEESYVVLHLDTYVIIVFLNTD